MTNLTYLDATLEDFRCRLISGKSCVNESFSLGLECATYGNSIDFNCELDLDIHNETSYSCFQCSNSSLDFRSYDVGCGIRFKLNIMNALVESVLKHLWLRIPNFDTCKSDTLFCYGDTNRTLYMDYLNDSDKSGLVDNIQCTWNENSTHDRLDSAGYEWSFLFVILFIVAGGVGNILVCLAVCLDKRLQNVTNYFLLSLAIADLLVSLFVMPMGAIPGFLGKNLIIFILRN